MRQVRFTYTVAPSPEFPHTFTLRDDRTRKVPTMREPVHDVTEAHEWCAERMKEGSYWRSEMFTIRIHYDLDAFEFRMRWC